MPRPGLALGAYPEREAPPVEKLDALVRQGIGLLTTRWESRKANLQTIARLIEQAGDSLVGMPDERLAAMVGDLKLRLTRDGWNKALAVQGFAMVREMSARTLGMRHFDSQILGGWVIFNGKLAEMQTGEGKTLTATLPAAVAAMAGVPVHVITANDYLASRDAQLMRPLYTALGLTVGVISEDMDFDARRAAYHCDITYCTNKQVAFDYLRDRVARGTTGSSLHLGLERIYDGPTRSKRLMLRGLCFAIVDEADSVLIDEARTPLVLSQTVDETQSEFASYTCALELARQLVCDEDFRISIQDRRLSITKKGSVHLEELSLQMDDIWHARRRREDLVTQALSALHLFERDHHYVVRDHKVQIVDGNTGRVMADRSWERGLHQMIEAKEGCELSSNKETLARISYQRFFRRYLLLSGMTGTAREVARELDKVYGLRTIRIPPNKPSQRRSYGERVFARAADAHAAIIASAREHATRARPVLIGTRSVAMSEELARLFKAAGLKAQVLNARQDEDEARIVARAGERGRITVATNMAGRGTDISLGSGVKEAGGLHVIVTERNDSARVDRQLIGRSARQGDPGSYEMVASLDDELPSRCLSPPIRRLVLGFAGTASGRIPNWVGQNLLDLAQRSLERRDERIRRQLEREDERLARVLSFAGAAE